MLARILLGWLDDATGSRLLSGSRVGNALGPEEAQRMLAARNAVELRDTRSPEDDPIEDLPSSYAPHVERLRSLEASAPYFTEGWEVRWVDLTRVIALQPLVYFDPAASRISAGVTDEAVAELTLPTQSSVDLSPQFDPARQAWMLFSDNTNLRVAGQLAGPIEGQNPNFPAFGFFVTILPSFMQVASYQGRYFLRDGYHRALDLLAHGVSQVPAFVRAIGQLSDLVPAPGMLPESVFLGPRPATLQDYLDDVVSAGVNYPAARRLVIVQAMELSPLEVTGE